MTVKELFQSIDFEEIIKALKDKYPDSALRPFTEYKENYDIICHTEFSGEGGTITYQEDGDSDVYMIEGDYYDNIVGMEVILPENNLIPKVVAAAEIIWSTAPFGRITADQWSWFSHDMISLSKANKYALQAKRVEILLDLPYCRDKKVIKELKEQMNSPEEDLRLSIEASNWLIFDSIKRENINRNRSKRKRRYRLKKRYEELIRLREVHECLDRVKVIVNQLPIAIEKEILTSKSIEKISYQTHTYGKSNRVYYLEDLLTNPLYLDSKTPFTKDNSIFICILYSSPHHSCSSEEKSRIEKILNSRFKNKKRYLILCQDYSQEEDLELEIISLNQII